MKKIMMTLAAVLCCFISVNAQTTETESNSERYLRLSKEADENPTDWKAQMEVVYILTDKNSGFYNQQRATRYLERIYHTATDYNKEVPDSVLRLSLVTLITLAFDKKDLDKTLFYIDELKHAKKVGVEISNVQQLGYYLPRRGGRCCPPSKERHVAGFVQHDGDAPASN